MRSLNRTSTPLIKRVGIHLKGELCSGIERSIRRLCQLKDKGAMKARDGLQLSHVELLLHRPTVTGLLVSEGGDGVDGGGFGSGVEAGEEASGEGEAYPKFRMDDREPA